MQNISLVKAFSEDSEQGNPAGVCLDASGMSDEQMQSIATELGFSESAFVLPSDVADYKVRFFAVKQEVDYCGHATVATYHQLFELPENKDKTKLSQETKAGIFDIEKSADGKIMMTQKSPQFMGIELDRQKIANLLGIPREGISESLPIQVVATNVAKLMVAITSLEYLKNIKPDIDAIKEYTNSQEGKGLYCFTKSDNDQYDFVARFFNPAVGINEDPATGVAAGPLACYADKYIFAGKNKQIKINQGMWMGKASEIFVELSEGVKVGGYAVAFGEYNLRYEQ